MAFLMGCEGAHLEFPAKLMLDDVTLGVHEGDRIGIVGKNGDGKSTLLGVLAGQIELEGGLVRRTRGLTIGVLGQTDSLSDDATVGYSVVGDAPEYEWASDPRIREIISELIADIDWNAKVGTLSGGQRRRVDLTRLLIGDYDVIMMDEPTNHLDIPARFCASRTTAGSSMKCARACGKCTTAKSSRSRAAIPPTCCSVSNASASSV